MTPNTVDIYETCICAGSRSTTLADFITKRYNDATVRVHDLSSTEADIPMPTALMERIESSSSQCLPALVVDGKILSEGSLPTLIGAVQAIESGEAVPSGSCDPGCCG